MVILESLLAALLSILVYKFVVQKQGTTLSYLFTYGLVFPTVFLGPFALCKVLSVRNQAFRFSLGAIHPVTCLFKTTAAAHGFTPSYAKASTKSFALYFSCPMMMERDPKLDKFVPVTLSEFFSHVPSFFKMILVTGMLLSMFLYFPNLVPPLAQGNLPADSDYYAISAFLRPQDWLLRNMLFGIFFQVIISALGEGLIMAQSLVTGYKTNILMDNPCLTARSLSEFWGSKWNLVIHDVLKCGVYQPVRKHFPKHVAMLSTFLASGVFHEILLWVFSYPLDNSHGCFDQSDTVGKPYCYRPHIFTTTIFFIYQAVFIALEFSPLGNLPFWGKIPTPIAAILVVMMGSPFGHYFVEPYWNSLFFENALAMFFVFKPVDMKIAT